VLNGVAKTYAMTGWRVGWMIGPTDLIKASTNLQSHATSNVANVSQRAALAERCVVLNGVAKTYAMTGWRVGWMIGPEDVITAATNLQSHSTSNVGNVAQRAALAAVSGDLEAVAMMRDAFSRRGKKMHALLSGIPGVLCPEPEGAFYCFPSFEGVLGRELGGRTVSSTLELADVLLEQAKVAIVPGEAFGAPGYARMSFALGDDDLGEGVGRIAEFLA